MRNFTDDRRRALFAFWHEVGQCARRRARDAKLLYVTGRPEDLEVASRVQREIDHVAEVEEHTA